MLAILALALMIVGPFLLGGIACTIAACMLSSRISRELEEMNETTIESRERIESYAAA